MEWTWLCDMTFNHVPSPSTPPSNGILIDHYLTEVNGQNVIGLKDKQIAEVFAESPRTVTITIMPKFVYDHMMKK